MQKTGNYYLSVVTHTAGRPIASDQVKDGGRWTTGGGVLGGFNPHPPPPPGAGMQAHDPTDILDAQNRSRPFFSGPTIWPRVRETM